jgi:hypothetical protein
MGAPDKVTPFFAYLFGKAPVTLSVILHKVSKEQ